MTEQQISLLPFYQGWDTYQELLIKAIEPLSLDQLSLLPAPQLRSIGENAAHIVGTRVGWLHYVLKEGGEDLVSRTLSNVTGIHPLRRRLASLRLNGCFFFLLGVRYGGSHSLSCNELCTQRLVAANL